MGKASSTGSLINTRCSPKEQNKTKKTHKINLFAWLIQFVSTEQLFLGTSCFPSGGEAGGQTNFSLHSATKANQLSIKRLFTPCHQLAHSQPPCLRLSAGQPGFLLANDLPAAAAARKGKKITKAQKLCHVVTMATANSFSQRLTGKPLVWRDSAGFPAPKDHPLPIDPSTPPGPPLTLRTRLTTFHGLLPECRSGYAFPLNPVSAWLTAAAAGGSLTTMASIEWRRGYTAIRKRNLKKSADQAVKDEKE